MIPAIKNPGNVTRLPRGEQWRGQIGTIKVGDVFLYVFGDIVEGIRACAVDSLTILERPDSQTFAEFAKTYSGTTDLDYASAIARECGQGSEEIIGVMVSAASVAQFVNGIFIAEGSTLRDPTTLAERMQGSLEALQYKGMIP